MQAYGPDGLGILTVAGVPGFAALRQRLLPLAQAFAVRHALSCSACFSGSAYQEQHSRKRQGYVRWHVRI